MRYEFSEAGTPTPVILLLKIFKKSRLVRVDFFRTGILIFFKKSKNDEVFFGNNSKIYNSKIENVFVGKVNGPTVGVKTTVKKLLLSLRRGTGGSTMVRGAQKL